MRRTDFEHDTGAIAMDIRVGTRPARSPTRGREGQSLRGTASPDRRFVMQSHVLGAPMANPRSLFIAATIAVALYLIGRRLSS